MRYFYFISDVQVICSAVMLHQRKVSVYVNGWAVQEHPYYPDKAREPNHMDD